MEAAQQYVAKEAPPRAVKSARRAKRAHLRRARLHILDTCHGGTWTRARSPRRARHQDILPQGRLVLGAP